MESLLKTLLLQEISFMVLNRFKAGVGTQRLRGWVSSQPHGEMMQ